MATLLTPEGKPLLHKKLVEAIATIGGLQDWLNAHFKTALSKLGPGNLDVELTNLMTWSEGEDDMQTLLQKLVDHPPSSEIPPLIFAFTLGVIKPSEPKTNQGLPQVPASQSWFAAGRPFVNRKDLRAHLDELRGSVGAESVLVIDGPARSGKSFAVSLALGFEEARKSLPPLDIDEFARVGAELNAREFAVLIAGDEKDCPPFDITKEDEAVPRLLFWLTKKLQGKDLWIIIDHCNRRVLTEGARSVLRLLAARLRAGALPKVRLILVDFDRNELPQDWRETVRHDQAKLPDKEHVSQWCAQLVAAAKRKCSAGAPKEWASEVFLNLDTLSQTDGMWHAEFERRLREAVAKVLACEELP